MKTAIVGFILIIMSVYSLGINISISEKDIRQDEIELSTDNAIRQTIKNAKIKEMYQIKDEDEMMADFNRTLLTQINSDSEITVKVYGINYQEGMMNIEVISKFKYFNGVEDEVSVRRTIIFNGGKIEGQNN